MLGKRKIGLLFFPLFFGFLTAGPPPARAAESLEKAVSAAATSLGEKLSAANLKKIGVAEFTDINGYRSALGPFLADELCGQLLAAPTGPFDLIDRQQLMKELAARNLNVGALDAAGTAEIGKALGLQAIVTGTITDLGQDINVAIRAVSIHSGVIAAAISVRFPRSGAAETLLRQTGGSPGPAGALGRKPTQTTDVFFKNNIVQITVESISLGREKQSVHLVLSLENIFDQDLNLRLDCRDASITSSTGEKYRCVSVEGIDGRWFGDWTNFAAKSRSVITFSFSADGEEAFPGFYSFSATVSRYVKDGSAVFSIGIPGIRLDPGIEGHQDR